jgi:hypothetical protein
LVAAGEVDDAQARVPETDAMVRRDPLSLVVRSAMVQRGDGAFQRVLGNRSVRRKTGSYATHDASAFAATVKSPRSVADKVKRITPRSFTGFAAKVNVRPQFGSRFIADRENSEPQTQIDCKSQSASR